MKNARRDKGKSNRKGRLAERIAAELHAGPGVDVQTRVRLPSTAGGAKRHEIDVLLTAATAGYEIQIPIECKNQTKAVGKAAVESFITKLRTVGLSVRLGIFISTSDFTSGARDTAKHWGIRIRVLKGLDKECLAEVTHEVTQSVVYLLCEIQGWGIWDRQGLLRPATPFYFESTSDYLTSIGDVMLSAWHDVHHRLPVGTHRITLTAPAGTYQKEVIDGELDAEISHICAIVNVTAAVLDIRGQATHNSLVDGFTKKVQKDQYTAKFDTRDTVAVRRFRHEDKLSAYLNGLTQSIRLTVGRIPLARIRFENMFWPPSERVRTKLLDLTDDGADPEATATLGFRDFESWPDSLFEAPAKRMMIPAPEDGSCLWKVQVDVMYGLPDERAKNE